MENELVEHSHSRVEILGKKTDPVCETIDFFYPSDDLKIRGLLTLPVQINSPLPLLVFNHGGINGLYTGLRNTLRELASQHGFAVFASSYRGEDGSDGEIEIASGEVDDVLNGLELLTKCEFINREKVFMVGSSHGALITLIAMARDKNNVIKKGVFGYGIVDIFKWWDYLAENDMLNDEHVSPEYYPGEPSMYPIWFQKRNGVEYVDSIKAPLLIIHGIEDHLVPVGQSEILYEALGNHSKIEVKLLKIPGEGHGLLTKFSGIINGTLVKSHGCETAWHEILNFLSE